MNEIQPFVFPATGQQMRPIEIDSALWFVASDVCSILRHTNTSRALSQLDDDEKQTLRRSDTLTGGYPFADQRVQSVALVNEAGLYTLILRSNLPAAKDFRRWVTHEVLPAIRRAGSYSTSGSTVPVRVEVSVSALAELAHREHVVPAAARILAFARWRKPRRGIEAFVQLALDIHLPGVDGATATAQALPPGKAVRDA